MDMAAESAKFQKRTIGRYQLRSLLGTGGMGEVYLARDSSLNRDVALKVLPEHLSQDTYRLHRFRQEARAASALNDPRIITIYEIGQVDGRPYIVAEYVEGKTLRTLINERVSLSLALELVSEIASALAVAHSRGIVHRDLKPENIMVRPDGRIKVLDFGLAKLTEPDDSEPVRKERAFQTEPGKIVGTIHYMSPEQALAKTVDHRADIFSLGVILYELVCGERPFQGSSDAAVYDSILNRAPTPLSRADRRVPAGLDEVIDRALEKDPDDRYQDTTELRRALMSLGDRRLETSPKPVKKTTRRPGRNRLMAVSIAAVAVFAFALLLSLVRDTVPQSEAEFSVRDATFTPLTTQSGREIYPLLMPQDGGLLFAAERNDRWNIYLQETGDKPVSLTDALAGGATEPALSPDGKQLAFSSPGQDGIFVMDLHNKKVRRLSRSGYNPAWSPDGREIVYASGYFLHPSDRAVFPSALWAVAVDSGRRRLITRNDAVQPHWSPGGHRIAYWGLHKGGQRDIWTIEAGGGEPAAVTDDAAVDWNPVWSPDGKYLYFVSDRSGSMNIWRIRIDELTGQTFADPEPVTVPAAAGGYISFSHDGRQMLYVHEITYTSLQELDFDPVQKKIQGHFRPIFSQTTRLTNPDLSPDQEWFVFDTVGAKQEDLFLLTRDGSSMRRLTDDLFKDRAPRWHPEGDQLLFFSDRSGRYELWTIRSDGSDLRQVTQTTGPGVQASLWSPDGRQILSSLQSGPPTLVDLDTLDREKPLESKTVPFPSGFLLWSWSPDGQKLAGFRDVIYLYNLNEGDLRRLPHEGARPVWLPDNRHLLYFLTDGLYLLDTSTGSSNQILSVAPSEFQSFGISADGRLIYASLITTDANVWLASMP